MNHFKAVKAIENALAKPEQVKIHKAIELLEEAAIDRPSFAEGYNIACVLLHAMCMQATKEKAKNILIDLNKCFKENKEFLPWMKSDVDSKVAFLRLVQLQSEVAVIDELPAMDNKDAVATEPTDEEIMTRTLKALKQLKELNDKCIKVNQRINRALNFAIDVRNALIVERKVEPQLIFSSATGGDTTATSATSNTPDTLPPKKRKLA